MQTKRCRDCGEDKPVTEFHRNKHSKDGLAYRCKPCACELTRLWRLANLDRERETNHQYYAANPGKHAQLRRAWRAANPDKVQESIRKQAPYLAEWGRQNHSRMRTAVFNHYGWSCVCCGSPENLAIDHVNGDGTRHRTEVGINTGTKTYHWLIADGFPPWRCLGVLRGATLVALPRRLYQPSSGRRGAPWRCLGVKASRRSVVRATHPRALAFMPAHSLTSRSGRCVTSDRTLGDCLEGANRHEE